MHDILVDYAIHAVKNDTQVYYYHSQRGVWISPRKLHLCLIYFFSVFWLRSTDPGQFITISFIYIKNQLFQKIKYYQKITKFLAILSTKKYLQNPWKTAKMVTNCPNWSRWPMLKEFTSNLLQRDSVARWMIIFFQKSRMIFNEVGLLGRIRKAES